MIKFFREHQLSIALVVTLACFQIAAAVFSEDRFSAEYWSTLMLGCSDGTITALIVVWAGRLRERGSTQGKD